ELELAKRQRREVPRHLELVDRREAKRLLRVLAAVALASEERVRPREHRPVVARRGVDARRFEVSASQLFEREPGKLQRLLDHAALLRRRASSTRASCSVSSSSRAVSRSSCGEGLRCRACSISAALIPAVATATPAIPLSMTKTATIRPL